MANKCMKNAKTYSSRKRSQNNIESTSHLRMALVENKSQILVKLGEGGKGKGRMFIENG